MLQTGTHQHFNEQDKTKHPGQLHWPGVRGLPVVANNADDVALLNEQDLKNFVVVNKYHARWFDLSNTQDLAEYTYVMEHILSKWFTLRKQDWHPVTTENPPKMMVWVEWIQQYAARDPRTITRSHPNGR